MNVTDRVETNVLKGFKLWKERERKDWLRECTRQLCKVIGGEVDRKEVEVKELLIRCMLR